jgi:hypothetical protein
LRHQQEEPDDRYGVLDEESPTEMVDPSFYDAPVPMAMRLVQSRVMSAGGAIRTTPPPVKPRVSSSGPITRTALHELAALEPDLDYEDEATVIDEMSPLLRGTPFESRLEEAPEEQMALPRADEAPITLEPAQSRRAEPIDHMPPIVWEQAALVALVFGGLGAVGLLVF